MSQARCLSVVTAYRRSSFSTLFFGSISVRLEVQNSMQHSLVQTYICDSKYHDHGSYNSSTSFSALLRPGTSSLPPTPLRAHKCSVLVASSTAAPVACMHAFGVMHSE